VYAGIKARAGAGVEVCFAQGCVLVKNEPFTAYDRWKMEQVELATDEENGDLIAEARNLAAEADVTILVVGETEALCREAYSDKVVGDAVTLNFVGSQRTLINAVVSTGKPVVMYLVNGRPLQIAEMTQRIPAIVEGWYMGQETGLAAASILFGDMSPSGKLSVSFPRSVGHIPAYYSKKPYAGPFPYVFSENSALYPFGHGLSYTNFIYSQPMLQKSEIGSKDETVASVEVTNGGARQADEIVQMYVCGEVAGVTRPVKELKGFRRINLRPGETRRVEFPITRETLAARDVHMKSRVQAGVYRIVMGGSSVAVNGVTLHVRP
jgi:beta-glucosidase